MAPGAVFLIGGGRNESALPHTYGRFVTALGGPPVSPIACVVLDDDDADQYVDRAITAFAAVGVGNVEPVFVSAERPLSATDLHGTVGVFVSGGLTPGYHDAIVPVASEWLPWLRERGIPYAGYSAGAMIAPVQAIVGGWRLRRGDREVAIGAEEIGEDAEFLEVRLGLGLVPFAVEPHASQWGTPTRLLHAVNAGLVPEGWAIDEDTMLEVRDGTITVHGLGSAYRVRQGGRSLTVDILGSGETVHGAVA